MTNKVNLVVLILFSIELFVKSENRVKKLFIAEGISTLKMFQRPNNFQPQINKVQLKIIQKFIN